MSETTDHPFRCPECRPVDVPLALRSVAEAAAVYACEGCGGWFPVQDGIVDFAPPESRDQARWHRFWLDYGKGAGLREPVRGDRSLNASVQRKFFDEVVDEYDHVVASSSFWVAHDALALQHWVRRLPADIDVIDLGAGSGRCTVPLAEALTPQRELVAVDISFEMLRGAARKLEQQGNRQRARLVVGDCRRLDFLRDERFDVAFCYGLLHHLDDPEPVFAALGRIMRPRANVLIHDNNASDLRRAFDSLMRRRPLWEAEHEGHPVVRLDDLRRWATAHGFQLHARTSVFVPPHLCELLTPRRSQRLLEITDHVMAKVPGVARHGGLIMAEAFRGHEPLALESQPRAVR
jgi:ubiquinone/menaquinone biosynthesis C-methylase UbiE